MGTPTEPQGVFIYGPGGYGREVADTARRAGLVVTFLSDSPEEIGYEIDGSPCARPELGQSNVVVTVADSTLRRQIVQRCEGLNIRFGRFVARTSLVSPTASLGEGVILSDFTLVNSRAQIGRHFHGNLFSIVAHDCVVGDFVTFAPYVSCNGNVQIGDGVYVGAGALLRNGSSKAKLVIGEGAVIGMGAVVTKDVAPYTTVIGNPARPTPHER